MRQHLGAVALCTFASRACGGFGRTRVIDVPYLDLEDPRGMETAARQARDLGFSGKGAIHPKQIAALNAVFTPDAAQIERARRVIGPSSKPTRAWS